MRKTPHSRKKFLELGEHIPGIEDSYTGVDNYTDWVREDFFFLPRFFYTHPFWEEEGNRTVYCAVRAIKGWDYGGVDENRPKGEDWEEWGFYSLRRRE